MTPRIAITREDTPTARTVQSVPLASVEMIPAGDAKGSSSAVVSENGNSPPEMTSDPKSPDVTKDTSGLENPLLKKACDPPALADQSTSPFRSKRGRGGNRSSLSLLSPVPLISASDLTVQTTKGTTLLDLKKIREKPSSRIFGIFSKIRMSHFRRTCDDVMFRIVFGLSNVVSEQMEMSIFVWDKSMSSQRTQTIQVGSCVLSLSFLLTSLSLSSICFLSLR